MLRKPHRCVMRLIPDFYGPYALANNPMYPHRIEMRLGGVLYQVKPALLNSLLIPRCGGSHSFAQACVHIRLRNRRIEPGNKLGMGFEVDLNEALI